jgi:hypothetical protein
VTYTLQDYIDLAYEELGLSHDGHEIGTTRFIELPEEVVRAICIYRLKVVRQHLFDRRDEPGWEELVLAYDFFAFKKE